jgi:GH43 family beta-xylosidase
MESEPAARNCWAPELFYDEGNQSWLVFWATTIPGRFPETKSAGDERSNHRMYVTTTKDFATLSKPELFYDDGFNVIDATIVRDGARFLMFLKDETEQPPAKNIRVATSTNAAGPYGPASPPITGAYWAEGPTVIQIGGRWVVYFDKYTESRFGAVASADLEHWEDISEKLTFPAGARHGTVFRVPEEVLETIVGKAK